MTSTPEGADAGIRADLGYPPRKDDWHFEVSTGDAEGTYRFTMFEGGESYLGTEIFDSLRNRFSTIPGVSEVEQEDRESYLVDSTLPEAELEAKLWTVFQAAASDAFARSHETPASLAAPPAPTLRVGMRTTGTVKWFNDTKGFGLITTEGGEDIYVTLATVMSCGYQTLTAGAKVEFEVKRGGPMGIQARNLTLV